MKAIWYETQGEAQAVLQYGDREQPAPGKGEVLVRLRTSAVNPSDVKKRAGAQPAGFVDGHVIPHSDGAGVIESVGEGVSGDRVGQRVWVYQAQFARHCGTGAQYVALPSVLAANLPANTGYDIAACLGIPVMTAHRCVFNAGDLSGRNVLVTGASGRVGYYAVQWAKMAGARVIATAGSDERCRVAAQSGADEVLNYRSDHLASEILDRTDQEGIDHIVEVEFGMNVQTSAAVIKNRGTISTYSSSLAPQATLPFYPLMFKNVSINLVLVYNMPDAAKEQAIEDIYTALEQARLSHRIAGTWSLEDTAKAHRAVEAGGMDGCAVIEIE